MKNIDISYYQNMLEKMQYNLTILNDAEEDIILKFISIILRSHDEAKRNYLDEKISSIVHQIRTENDPNRVRELAYQIRELEF